MDVNIKNREIGMGEKDINAEKDENYENRDRVVALKYRKGYSAPKIIAKGSGYVAKQIIDIAEKNDIAIHTDENLAENLNKLELGSDIPKELFEIVAQIYAFIGKIETVLDQNETN